MWWGYSPALDLVEEYERLGAGTDDAAEELEILMVGAGDGRHVLKTLAQRYRHAPRSVRLWVTEDLMDQVARQMLLLTLALEPTDVLGLRDKARFFLELYGNTMLRPGTASYLRRKADQLVHMATDLDFQVQRMPLLRLDRLRYRERDQLENIFKLWRSPPTIFPVQQCWDRRLRSHLGTRYDSRVGVFDWDYHMRLAPHGGQSVTAREYKRWRGGGVAFTWLETEPCEPNLTLASGAVQVGQRVCHHGYLGDVVTGPFPAFGLGCEDASMLRRVSGHQGRSTTDIAERNVTRLMHELLHQTPYIPPSCEDVGWGEGVVITEVTEVNAALGGEVEASRGGKKETYSAVPVEGAQVVFLPGGARTYMARKFPRRFHALWLPQRLFGPDLLGAARPGALVAVETPLFHLNVRRDDVARAAAELDAAAKAAGCAPLLPLDPLQDSVAMFAAPQ
ncbi:dynein axonemal assembly factor 3 [Periplaneta americana]|uniref:dynein axonemal assembly factor 3 n=1 Tax=Periplaneta americana TaxID=6978 RepID=UPI0037E7F4E4